MKSPIKTTTLLFKGMSLGVLIAFIGTIIGPLPLAQAEDFRLPAPGVMVHLSPSMQPHVLKGVTVYPDNPFKFDFILDKGDQHSHDMDLKAEASKLIKYFLASLTTPEKDLWVNLSPYEKNRIIPESFGQTGMGRDLLAEDYLLKQITASLIYPEDEIGKRFWKNIYGQAARRFGTTNIPVNTFNKVWIVPGHAKVYEHGNTAFVVQARLKVMLEQDYLALERNTQRAVILSPSTLLRAGSAKDPNKNNSIRDSSATPQNDVNALGSQIVREIVIPELEREVNEGKNFATLRQVYYSLILAVWFKKRMKESILGRKYMDQNKIAELSFPNDSIGNSETIYQRYLRAFKKGVYNYIKEEQDPITQEMIPRKYFSGGFVGSFAMASFAMTHEKPEKIPNASQVVRVDVNLADSAMRTSNNSRKIFTLTAAGVLALGLGVRHVKLAPQKPKEEPRIQLTHLPDGKKFVGSKIEEDTAVFKVKKVGKRGIWTNLVESGQCITVFFFGENGEISMWHLWNKHFDKNQGNIFLQKSGARGRVVLIYSFSEVLPEVERYFKLHHIEVDKHNASLAGRLDYYVGAIDDENGNWKVSITDSPGDFDGFGVIHEDFRQVGDKLEFIDPNKAMASNQLQVNTKDKGRLYYHGRRYNLGAKNTEGIILRPFNGHDWQSGIRVFKGQDQIAYHNFADNQWRGFVSVQDEGGRSIKADLPESIERRVGEDGRIGVADLIYHRDRFPIDKAYRTKVVTLRPIDGQWQRGCQIFLGDNIIAVYTAASDTVSILELRRTADEKGRFEYARKRYNLGTEFEGRDLILRPIKNLDWQSGIRVYRFYEIGTSVVPIATHDFLNNRARGFVSIENLDKAQSNSMKSEDKAMRGNDLKSQYRADIEKIYDVYHQLAAKQGLELPLREDTIKKVKLLSPFQTKLLHGVLFAIGAGTAAAPIAALYPTSYYIDPNSMLLRFALALLSVKISFESWNLLLHSFYASGYTGIFVVINNAGKNNLDTMYTISHEMAHYFNMPQHFLYANSYEYLINEKLGFGERSNTDFLGKNPQLKEIKNAYRTPQRTNPGVAVAQMVFELFPGSFEDQEIILRKFLWGVSHDKFKEDDSVQNILNRIKSGLKKDDYTIFPEPQESSWTYAYGSGIAHLALLHYGNVDDALNYIYRLGKLRNSKLALQEDRAMNTRIHQPKTGGIDLTANRMKLDVDSDKTVLSQPMNLKALEKIEIGGLYIKDIEIKPLNNLPEILGVAPPAQP